MEKVDIRTNAKFVRKPTEEELKEIDRRRRFNTSEQELEEFRDVYEISAAVFNRVLTIPEQLPRVEFPRTAGYRPTEKENKYNQWTWKCTINGASGTRTSGTGLLLTDRRVAVKDMIMVAGMPMNNGSRVLHGYTPEVDATVVDRVLRHGGEIVGKTNMDDMGLSTTGFFAWNGPMKNPWRPDTFFAPGGSSGGSAIVVATGEADMALGADQGGSIRIPSSYCGIVGLKPTYGLVPYTGAVKMASAVDCLGPMTRTVDDCATLLQAIAGFDDNRDHRQPSTGFKTPNFTDIVGTEPKTNTRRIGILKQGFNNCHTEVAQTVNKAIEAIKASKKFVEIVEVDFPEHLLASAAWCVANCVGMSQQTDMGGNCAGDHGVLNTSLSTAFERGLCCAGHELSTVARCNLLFADYAKRRHGPAAFAHAQTVLYDLRKQYDRLFTEGRGLDALLMPTVPTLPSKYPEQLTKDRVTEMFTTVQNTAAFNGTHHPSITLNCGYSKEQLPVGMMLVGRHWHDYELLEMAKVVETTLKHLQKPWPQ